jgi:hypothetical protein
MTLSFIRTDCKRTTLVPPFREKPKHEQSNKAYVIATLYNLGRRLMNTVQWQKDTDKETLKHSQKKFYPSATLCTTNPVRTDITTNPGVGDETPATDRTSHGKATLKSAKIATQEYGICHPTAYAAEAVGTGCKNRTQVQSNSTVFTVHTVLCTKHTYPIYAHNTNCTCSILQRHFPGVTFYSCGLFRH